MHEYTWPGNMDLVKAIQGLEKLTKEQSTTMLDTVLVPVNNYLDVFPDLKDRMDKRDRKLLDYNRCKRTLDIIKSKDTIKEDKLGKAQEDYSQHRMIFEEVNSELCEDLPEFFNSRKQFLAKFLEGFFERNKEFHKEYSQVYSEAHAALIPLHEQCASDPPSSKEVGNVEPYFTVTDGARKFKRQSLRKSFRKGGSFRRSASMGAMSRQKSTENKDKTVPVSMSNLSVDPYNSPAPVQQAQHYSPKGSPATTPARPKPPRSPRNEYVNDSAEVNTGGEKSLTPFDATVKIEPGTQDAIKSGEKVEVGTEVECIHEYKAVDDDELSFVAGDLITVGAWDSPDEQDEGWFMGILEGGAKGAFPINYTRLHKPVKTNGYMNVPECDATLDIIDEVKVEVKEGEMSEVDLGSNREYDAVPDEDTNGDLVEEAECLAESLPNDDNAARAVSRAPPSPPQRPEYANLEVEEDIVLEVERKEMSLDEEDKEVVEEDNRGYLNIDDEFNDAASSTASEASSTASIEENINIQPTTTVVEAEVKIDNNESKLI